MSAPELVALMLADGRLPTGGHTQSGGLEPAGRAGLGARGLPPGGHPQPGGLGPAVRAGLGADGKQLDHVAQYARARLRTIPRVEAAVAVVTRHLTLRATPPPSPSRADWFAGELDSGTN